MEEIGNKLIIVFYRILDHRLDHFEIKQGFDWHE